MGAGAPGLFRPEKRPADRRTARLRKRRTGRTQRARRDRREGCRQLRRTDRPALHQGRHLIGQRGERTREPPPGDSPLELRAGGRAGPGRLGEGAGASGGRLRRRTGKAHLLHGHVPHDDRPDDLLRRERGVSRARQPDLEIGPNQLLDLLVLGHLPGPASVVHHHTERPRGRHGPLDAFDLRPAGETAHMAPARRRNQPDARLRSRADRQ